jgi:biopolymer transport protein ExbB
MLDLDLRTTWETGVDIWRRGGWAMIPLALSAFMIYSKAAQIRLMFTTKDFTMRTWHSRLRERKPKKSLRMTASERDAEIGRMYLRSRKIKYPKDATFDDATKAFSELRANEFPPVDRNLKFMKVAMASAPLWGLLGTVTGMLKTFASLATGGGDSAASSVAAGISEALITTETGLMVALPGYFFLYFLGRKREKYEAFVAHLEAACTQEILHRQKHEHRAAA